jgi:hypothetical protein
MRQPPLNSSVRPQNVLLSVLGASVHLVARAHERLVFRSALGWPAHQRFQRVLGYRKSRAPRATQCASCAPYRHTTRGVFAVQGSFCAAGFFPRRPSPF